jgi:hypothetical protein
MGMTCSLWRLSATDAERLAGAASTDIETFLFGAPLTPPPAAGGGLVGWLKRLSPIRVESPEEPPPRSDAVRTQAREELDLEKAWHGLHFLLTGTAWEGDEPACYLLKGGEDFGADEIGDSVARLLRPPRVEAFAAFLSRLGRDELKARFDPSAMMQLEIYPEVWEDEQDEELAYLLDSFDVLRAFIRTAATEGDAVVILVS